jgi:hypothetical protein
VWGVKLYFFGLVANLFAGFFEGFFAPYFAACEPFQMEQMSGYLCPFGRMALALKKTVPTPFCRKDTSY